jgi:hypothetical protein
MADAGDTTPVEPSSSDEDATRRRPEPGGDGGTPRPPDPDDARGVRDATGRLVARSPIRALDPASDKRRTNGLAALPALYLTDRLLERRGDGVKKSSDAPDSTDTPDTPETGRRRGDDVSLSEALDEIGLDFEPTVDPPSSDQEFIPPRWGRSITLRSRDAIEPVDAWSVLQDLRVRAPQVAARLSLEHVLRPAGGYWGGIGGYWGGIGGYWGGIGGYWGGIGTGADALQEYAVAGRGGRMPVSLALPDPALRARALARPPVVVVPDTGVAPHPWFKDEGVVRLRYRDGRLEPDTRELHVADTGQPGAGDGAGGDESAPRPSDPAGLLAGHATFIAGLVRQGCPEATIVSIPVMGDDGVVDEGYLLDVLEALLRRHEGGQGGGEPSDVVDVLSLSMGYYAEDSTYLSGPVHAMLDRFAAAGVAVVAGVGNEGTTDPFVPASLAPTMTWPAVPDDQPPPVASVGACNPDGTTVALFSNDLSVVTAVRLGVSLVSTLPLTDGMGQPSAKVQSGDTVRCTVDPDDYTGGFGVWSGTSFATPVFSAELAAALVDAGGLDDVAPDAMRRRAVKALDVCTHRGKKP